MKALDSSFSFYTPKEEGETQTQTKEVDSFDSW